MIVIFIFMIIIGVFTYLLILGADKCKTDYERKLEAEEQIEFLREYKKRRQE